MFLTLALFQTTSKKLVEGILWYKNDIRVNFHV